MARTTGTYQTTEVGGEPVKAFVPNPLPPCDPPLVVEGGLATLHRDATAAVERLNVAGSMVPKPDWFL